MTEGVQQQQHQHDAGQAAAWAGPRWLWFGVLGGMIAWSLHLVFAWITDELACTRGDAHVFGIPLRTVSLVLTILPLLAAAGALVVAWRAAATLRAAESDPPAGVPPRRIHRARLMADVGAWLDGLCVMMIIFGGVAVVTFSSCVR